MGFPMSYGAVGIRERCPTTITLHVSGHYVLKTPRRDLAQAA